MRIAIRVDASRQIGTGHLRRCLSIAEALTTLGAEVRFVIRRLDEVGQAAFGASAFPVDWLSAPDGDRAPTRPDAPSHLEWAGVDQATDGADTVESLRAWGPVLVIVDHYAFDARWHDQVRDGLACRMMAIDDLADRPLAVDPLLNANLADHAQTYAGRLKAGTRVLGGPRFAILGEAYRSQPPYAFSPVVRSLGVFMGGTDPDGASARVLRDVRRAGFAGPVEIVSTSGNPYLPDLSAVCGADAAATLTLDLPDLAAFYARHDLQIGGGGTANYERCRIGAPGIAITLAANQLAVVPQLAALGALRVARLEDGPDWPGLRDAPLLADAVRALIADPAARRDMSEKGRALVDGRGTERIALCLMASTLKVRPAKLDDGEMLHAWRDHPQTRAVSGNSAPIPLNGHMDWLARKLDDAGCRLFVAEIGGTAVGSIRFDRQLNEAWEVSLYLDPDLTGLGLGRYLLQAGERAMCAEIGEPISFSASVMPGNEASARLFTNAGYSGGPLRYAKQVAEQKSEP
ncbi:MAG: UDP-2,4-diacetamido-2,4,6-trideoxy-beta-L-altropyranose hydrolase [Brevundimonas sp.]|nr:UDP-2,4-diacetamido-2,4,6-trideoxy-beta-L-altropyranose hydrolase [Brevundimonas sp.]